ncbi:hypothetical protein [Maridesulfovibrio bastinii]|uniref:hypothetical protein n=1 Tax=Maridesulfovibrio bastinii TaxID=47157 RepID=UPI00040D0E95|nr:hypothetical protein [Maridesulfovibrio bastinii]
MKIRKKLEIAGKEYKLVSEDIRLELSCSGRAVFQLQANEPVSGLVRFYVGYSFQDKDRMFFSGYVEKCYKVDNSQQRIFCRELAGVLAELCPVSLRHPTLKDVLEQYTQKTGLVFIIPEHGYSIKRVPYFQTIGSGFHGISSIGKVFQIDDYVWNPQPDGQIFIGSWKDSRWATRLLKVADKWFHRVLTDGSEVCPIFPALRPGANLNGRRVKQVRLKGHEMVVTCVKS